MIVVRNPGVIRTVAGGVVNGLVAGLSALGFVGEPGFVAGFGIFGGERGDGVAGGQLDGRGAVQRHLGQRAGGVLIDVGGVAEHRQRGVELRRHQHLAVPAGQRVKRDVLGGVHHHAAAGGEEVPVVVQVHARQLAGLDVVAVQLAFQPHVVGGTHRVVVLEVVEIQVIAGCPEVLDALVQDQLRVGAGGGHGVQLAAGDHEAVAVGHSMVVGGHIFTRDVEDHVVDDRVLGQGQRGDLVHVAGGGIDHVQPAVRQAVEHAVVPGQMLDLYARFERR